MLRCQLDMKMEETWVRYTIVAKQMLVGKHNTNETERRQTWNKSLTFRTTCGGGKHSVKQYLPHPMHCPQHQLLLMMVLQVFITFTSPPALSSSTFSCPLLPLQQAIKVHNQHSTVDFRKRTIDMCVTIYVAKGYLFWIYYETKTCSAL